MATYLTAIWRCRYFWLSMVRMDLRTRYSRSVLGVGWSLLQPLAMTLIICIVFHQLFDLNIREYCTFLLMGLCFWNYVITVVINGCQCLFLGESYIRQYPAPLAIYPLRTVLGGLFHFLISLVVVLLMQWYLNGPGNLVVLPWSLLAIVYLAIFGWAVAVLAGFATAFLPDTRHISEVGLQLVFYGTPIIYPPE
ncbi:MAG: ABC transporter permease, partial [Planctomycetaceae bacterium]